MTSLHEVPRTIRVAKLTIKLDAMLSNPHLSEIITWMPHGKSWKVTNQNRFLQEVMPKYFEYSNYNSFNRLVNAWGFKRIKNGPDRNSYHHKARVECHLLLVYTALIQLCYVMFYAPIQRVLLILSLSITYHY
mmetsp:Transcript_48902/g.57126  ORF Transcript_48902/g.57126 Transcript_48902/m.57126 type:complete len:133 (-) Transcript_48902:523-921(-)